MLMTTIRSRRTTWFAAGLITLMALGGLSGCAEDRTAQGDSQGSGGGGTSSEESSAGDDGSDQARYASPTDCLVGTWLADNKQLGALFKSAAAGTDAAGSVSDPTGKVLVTFGPEGEYKVTYKTWTMRLRQDGMTVELIREGADEGTYQATDDGAVEWNEFTMGSVATMKSAGGSFEVPADPSETSGTYVCEEDVLKITAEGSTTGFNRQ